MGVPKFFRWVSERYPTVITPFKDSPPPIDNLYLDMNGIIHNCTHTNDFDASKKAPTEKEMVQAIFAYLEKLFQAIQPKKHFVMAVDGVAPRAKMNQQRQRRYRAGYEMMVSREEALARGEDLPEEGDVFDSNCITPGTEFMVRLSEHFKYFVTMKLATDTAWQNCKVIFSGHDHPGEGEHKIVDFMRRRKMQPDYDPNETHCMYGLDADLIMLALATHERRFVLLREVVSFNSPQSRKERERKEEDEAKGIVEDPSLVKADEFVLFHINVFLEYLDIDLKSRLVGPYADRYSLERFIDDFVFMCFFIGNDFLPSVPTLGINDGGMLTMISLYAEHVVNKGTYLIRDGQINWNSVELFLAKLGELELETIRARQEEEAEHQRKRRRRDDSHEVQSSQMPVTSIVEYKQKFYGEKHGFEKGWDPRSNDMETLRQHYIEGLMWVHQYYYQGVASWKWFFPHHYAPLASDLVNLSNIAGRIRFEKGEPFLPHQQLLAVLPPMSYRSIPKAYWPLLRSKASPLAKFFPEHLEIDREGAHAPWEGIVLIPFIDEKVLLVAYETAQRDVTAEDQAKNINTIPTLFTADKTVEPYEYPSVMFRPLYGVQVRRIPFNFPASGPFIPRLLPGARVGDKEIEGFSSLASKVNHIIPTFEVGTVTIFGAPTRKESLILQLDEPRQAMHTVDDAYGLVGQEILVGYPHYKRARVSAISDRRRTIMAEWNNDGKLNGSTTKDLTGEEMSRFRKECETHQQYLKAKLGLALTEIHLLVYVHRFVGMKLTRKGRLCRQYAKSETCYPLQITSRIEMLDILEDERYVERDRAESDTAIGSKVIFMGPEPKNSPLEGASVFGSVGFVTEMSQNNEDYLTVAVKVFEGKQTIPQSMLDYATSKRWHTLHDVADRLRVQPLAITMLCSSLLASPQYGGVELGLCMKFTGKNLARVGYAKLVTHALNPWYVGNSNIFEKMEQDAAPLGHHLEKADGKKGEFLGRSSANQHGKGTWYFSDTAMKLIEQYVTKFEPVVRRLESGGANANHMEPSSFLTGKWQNSEVDDVLEEITNFLTESGIMEVPMINATEDSFSRELITELEQHLQSTTPRPSKEFFLRGVLRRNLYFPTIKTSTGYSMAIPLPRDQRYQIGARVVYCRTTGAVPFGSCGTIVRLLATGQEAEVVYDDPFTGGTMLGGRLTTPRGALTKLSALLVTSLMGAGTIHDGETPLTVSSTGSLTTAVKATTAILIQEARRQATPSAVTLTSANGGGIRLADLKLPVSPTRNKDEGAFPRPPVAAAPAPAPTAGQTAPVPVPKPRTEQPPQVVAPPTAAAPAVTTAPAAAASPPRVSSSYLIKKQFVSGEIVIKQHAVAHIFSDLVSAYLKQKLDSMK